MSSPLVPDDERPATADGTEPATGLVPDEERPVPDEAALPGDEPGALPDAERPVTDDEDASFD